MKTAKIMKSIEPAAALAVNDPKKGEKLYQKLLAAAAKARCKTDFKNAYAKALKRMRKEVQLAEVAEAEREVINLGDPSTLNEDLRRAGEVVGAKRLGFNFGGAVVGMRAHQSASGFTYRRGADGKKLHDADGVPIKDPVRVTRPVPMQPADAEIAALDACIFVRPDLEDPVVSPPSPSLMTPLWSPILPALAGVAAYPVLWNGELLSGSGYHEGSRLYLQSDDDMGVEWDPTVDEAVAFLRDEWLGEFPFQDDSALAAALMLPATLLHSRTTLLEQVGPPMFMVSASAAGTGKSYLAETLGLAVTGRVPATTPYADDEHARKLAITTAVIESWPIMLLDNLKSGSFIGSKDRALTQLLTTQVWKDRILGVSASFEGPAGILVAATGNNVIFAGDMARRVIECRLSAPEDQNLALRTFKRRDLHQWTRKNRPKILAALRKVLAIEAKGEPIGGFPAWSRVVAHPILTALGVRREDFFAPWIEAAEEDAKGLQLRGMYDLANAIATIRTDAKVQPLDGAWFTAAELLKELKVTNMRALKEVTFDNKTPDARDLAFTLKRSRDARLEGENGTFTIQTARVNLGRRTKGEARPVFRVKRGPGAVAAEADNEVLSLRGKKRSLDSDGA